MQKINFKHPSFIIELFSIGQQYVTIQLVIILDSKLILITNYYVISYIIVISLIYYILLGYFFAAEFSTG